MIFLPAIEYHATVITGHATLPACLSEWMPLALGFRCSLASMTRATAAAQVNVIKGDQATAPATVTKQWPRLPSSTSRTLPVIHGSRRPTKRTVMTMPYNASRDSAPRIHP